jgi:tRNA(Ile)-lysidine synthase
VPLDLSVPEAPVAAAEFAATMDRLGPFGASRRVAVAVSGGGDSMALALLAAGWGAARGFIVDHGLRAGSDAVAALVAGRLARLGVAARILTLAGLRAGAGVPARARAARYAALAAACEEEGYVHLLVAHQRADQAETRLMRAGRGSGPAGLAGIAAILERDGLRILRPLLGVPPSRLRATLRAAGVPWVEDPTNEDRRFLRPRLRQAIGAGDAGLAGAAGRDAAFRAAREAEIAAVLAARATFHEAGFARLSPGAIAPDALAALIQAVSGASYPPERDAVARLAAAPRAATLGGARIMPAGRMGAGWIVLREQAAIAQPIPACDGAIWDGRFRLRAACAPPAGATIGALGPDAARFRRASTLSSSILATLPTVRLGERLIAVPHIEPVAAFRFLPATANPAARAPFLALEQEFGHARDAKEQEAPYVVEWRRPVHPHTGILAPHADRAPRIGPRDWIE